MRVVLVLLAAVLSACAARAPAAAPAPAAASVPPPGPPGGVPPGHPGAEVCLALLDETLNLMDGEPEKADAAYADGYARCGNGFGFLEARTFVAFRAARWDDGAEHLIRAVSEAGVREMALKLLFSEMGNFSPAMQERLRGLGKAAEAPIYVPDIGAEYAWIAIVSCGVNERVSAAQALVYGPRGRLDRMTFTCPGATEARTVFFDFSADPMDQALIRELGAQKAKSPPKP